MRVNIVDLFCIHIEENRKVKPVEIVLSLEGEEEKEEQWRG
jgi:hypothetical protein